MTIHERVARLRNELGKDGLAGFLVPRVDEHQGEYVPPRAQRVAWLTGFTGSAGLAVVLTDRAAIFVDGRYTLQVRDEAPADVFEYHHVTESPPVEWLRLRLRGGDRLGYDPWLHTIESVERELFDESLIAAAEWYCRSALIDRSKVLPQPNTTSSVDRSVADPFQSALSLLLRAVRSDNSTAFLIIADMYETGRGVPNNPILVWCWLKLAAQKGASDAVEKLSKLEIGMSGDQLQAARTKLNELTLELVEIARVAK
jgi:hypothetical protein